MHENNPAPIQPSGEVVFQDISTDGSLTITVWREGSGADFIAQEFGDMGIIRVYDSYTGQLYHEERVALSRSAIFGPGPNDQEVDRWSNIISMFSE